MGVLYFEMRRVSVNSADFLLDIVIVKTVDLPESDVLLKAILTRYLNVWEKGCYGLMHFA